MRYLSAPALLAALCLSACAKRPAPAPVEPPAPAVVEAPAPVVVEPATPPTVEREALDLDPDRINTSVLFEYDSDTLKPQQLRNLVRLCAAQIRPLRLDGYASGEGGGARFDYNYGLSYRRVMAVHAALMGAGCHSVAVDWHGETDHFGSEPSLNRRVTIQEQ